VLEQGKLITCWLLVVLLQIVVELVAVLDK
jgi:hypothetical protein